MSVVKFLIVLSIIVVVSGRLSYYYADQGLNYHPPWDKYTGAYNNPQNGDNGNNVNNGNNGANNCNFTFNCPAGFRPVQNTSYQVQAARTCPVPDWLTGPTRTTALTIFNDCCYQYSICLQTCGVRKAFCDGQFEGCSYTQCNPTRVLRPGDRLYCRGLVNCVSSYNARADTCSTFANYQASACTCVAGNAASASSTNNFLPTPSTTATASVAAVGKRQDGSLTSQASFSSSPSTNPSVSSAPSFSPSSVPSPNLDSFGNYFVRTIPQWELLQNRCPPQFNNYVAVFTDQDQDDIGYYGGPQDGAASSMHSWLF